MRERKKCSKSGRRKMAQHSRGDGSAVAERQSAEQPTLDFYSQAIVPMTDASIGKFMCVRSDLTPTCTQFSPPSHALLSLYAAVSKCAEFLLFQRFLNKFLEQVLILPFYAFKICCECTQYRQLCLLLQQYTLWVGFCRRSYVYGAAELFDQA